ncbi:hypothetical protein HZS_271 [Henneguya salminicola]|nr:hypothetical protein HZS_271 [Henneguya salminicola]
MFENLHPISFIIRVHRQLQNAIKISYQLTKKNVYSDNNQESDLIPKSLISINFKEIEFYLISTSSIFNSEILLSDRTSKSLNLFFVALNVEDIIYCTFNEISQINSLIPTSNENIFSTTLNEFIFKANINSVYISSFSLDDLRTTLCPKTEKYIIYGQDNFSRELWPYLTINMYFINLIITSKNTIKVLNFPEERFPLKSNSSKKSLQNLQPWRNRIDSNKTQSTHTLLIQEPVIESLIYIKLKIDSFKIEFGRIIEIENNESIFRTCAHIIETVRFYSNVLTELIGDLNLFILEYRSISQNRFYQLIKNGSPNFINIPLSAYKRINYSNISTELISNFSFFLLYLIENSLESMEFSHFIEISNSDIFSEINSELLRLIQVDFKTIQKSKNIFLDNFVWNRNKFDKKKSKRTRKPVKERKTTNFNDLINFYPLVELFDLCDEIFHSSHIFDLNVFIPNSKIFFNIDDAKFNNSDVFCETQVTISSITLFCHANKENITVLKNSFINYEFTTSIKHIVANFSKETILLFFTNIDTIFEKYRDVFGINNIKNDDILSELKLGSISASEQSRVYCSNIKKSHIFYEITFSIDRIVITTLVYDLYIRNTSETLIINFLNCFEQNNLSKCMNHFVTNFSHKK